MKFSVIVPVYNAENYIVTCVESLMKQTFQDFEIVLVNDGSKDKTGALCEAQADAHSEKIKVIHQENQGPLLTRLNGINSATGEYCVFLDVDDELVDNGLELLYQSIEEYQSPDMLIYSFFYDDLSGNLKRANPLFEENSSFENENEKKMLYERFFTTTLLNNVWTKAVKRTVFEKDNVDYSKYSNLRCSEDRLLSMGMVSHAARVAYIKEPIYIYKLMPNSITRTFDIKAIDRFNVKVLYNEELNYIHKWKLDYEKWKARLDAGYIMQTWYVLDMYYHKVQSRRLKNRILEYDWASFVPEEINSYYKENVYLNEQRKICWSWVLQKNKLALKSYFLKKTARRFIRNLIKQS